MSKGNTHPNRRHAKWTVDSFMVTRDGQNLHSLYASFVFAGPIEYVIREIAQNNREWGPGVDFQRRCDITDDGDGSVTILSRDIDGNDVTYRLEPRNLAGKVVTFPYHHQTTAEKYTPAEIETLTELRRRLFR